MLVKVGWVDSVLSVKDGGPGLRLDLDLKQVSNSTSPSTDPKMVYPSQPEGTIGETSMCASRNMRNYVQGGQRGDKYVPIQAQKGCPNPQNER